MTNLDDEIVRHLAESVASGELQAAASYGKPLADIEGWHETPEALRMPFKILKEAGVAPPEIALFRERASLRDEVAAARDRAERDALQRKLSELEQKIALRLESLRIHAAL